MAWIKAARDKNTVLVLEGDEDIVITLNRVSAGFTLELGALALPCSIPQLNVAKEIGESYARDRREFD